MFNADGFDDAPGSLGVGRQAAGRERRDRGARRRFRVAQNRAAAMASVRSYRQWMARYAGMRLLDVWYTSITEADIREAGEATGLLQGRSGAARRARFEAIFSKARRRDDMRAFESLTTVVDGRRVILEDPPVVTHVEGDLGLLEKVFTDYRATMPESRRDYLERYRFVDFALKVVGVGSVGTRCFVLVLQGRDENDPLILQAKEATASVLEPYLEPSAHPNHAQRVVVGQQLMQATSDSSSAGRRGPAGRDFYLRQLWDMKGSVDTTTLQAPGLGFYGRLCGSSLARAHATTGDAAAISAYLGDIRHFDGAIADFSETYADVNARDTCRVPDRDQGGPGVGAGRDLTPVRTDVSLPGRTCPPSGGRVAARVHVRALAHGIDRVARAALGVGRDRRGLAAGLAVVVACQGAEPLLVRERGRDLCFPDGCCGPRGCVAHGRVSSSLFDAACQEHVRLT